jgi:hypothetical protein
MEDLQARFTYDLSANNTVTLSVIESYSNLNRSSAEATWASIH